MSARTKSAHERAARKFHAKRGTAKLRPVIPNAKSIMAYFHCAQCLGELLQGKPNHQSLEVGFTKIGLQVWCKRHDSNVVHVDFEGLKHPADMSRS